MLVECPRHPPLRRCHCQSHPVLTYVMHVDFLFHFLELWVFALCLLILFIAVISNQVGRHRQNVACALNQLVSPLRLCQLLHLESGGPL